MKKMYSTLVCGALTVLASVSAQAAGPVLLKSDIPLVSSACNEIPHLNVASVAATAAEAATEEKHRVTIKFNDDGEDIEPAIINFYNENGETRGTRPGGMSASIDLPAGRYDAVCLFESNSLRSRFPYGTTIWVVKEGIEVNGDTEVTFDAGEVKEPIKVRLVHADGSDVTINTIVKNADKGYDIVEKGNTEVILHRVVLVADGTKGYMSGGGSYNSHEIPGDYSKLEFDAERVFDLWINPLSDRFSMAVMRMLINEDCVEVVGCPVTKIDPNVTVTNDKSNYISDKAKFVHSPAYDLRTQEYDFPYNIMARVGIDADYPYLLSASLANEAGHNVKICVDEANDPFVYGVQYGLADRIDVQVIREEIIPGFFYEDVQDNTKSITSPWAFLDNGKLNYAINYQDYDLSEGLQYPGAPAHAFTSQDNLVAFGESVPFIQLFFSASKSEDLIRPTFSTASVGMGGEVRYSDNADILMSIKVDGKETLSDDVNTVSKWRRLFNFADSTPSEIVISASHSNSKVDDIIGKSAVKTNINFTNGADGDYFPPVIASIQTRVSGDIITQSFGKAEHGVVSVYAGDINTVFGEEDEYGDYSASYVYSDLRELRIEYALHDSDDYKTLSVETNGEPDDKYGQLYTASLSEVEGKNNSWYDLRVTAIDAAGNSQEQVIAPAFYIFSTSGIDAVGADSPVSYKVIERTIVSDAENFAVYNASGLQVSPYSLAPGVYVVRAGETVEKVVIE